MGLALAPEAWVIGVALACVATTAMAQPDAAGIAAQLAKNQSELRQYVWQSRVEVEVGGDSQKVELYQVRYDFNGELERTRLGGEEADRRPRGTPLRRVVVARKQAQASEFLDAVQEHLRRYMSQTSMSRAFTTAFARVEDGRIRLRAEGVVSAGDTVEFVVAEATRKPVTMLIDTAVDGEQVRVTVDFKSLPAGPNYPARQVLRTRTAGKALVITTENFNYSR